MKKLFILTVTVVFFISMFTIQTLAMPTKNEIYDKISLDDLSTKFGTYSIQAERIGYKDFLVYDSFWAPWQDKIYEKYENNKYLVYESDKFLDIPIEIFFSERFQPNEKYQETIELNQTYTYTHGEISREAINTMTRIYGSHYMEGALFLDFFKAKEKITNGFEIGLDYLKDNILNTDLTISYSKKYIRNKEFVNNYGRPVFLKKCMRQRFKTFICMEYTYNYDKKRTGSGALGKDSHYSYKFKNYTCSDIFAIMYEVNEPYYEESVYLDYGTQEYYNPYLDNVIF